MGVLAKRYLQIEVTILNPYTSETNLLFQPTVLHNEYESHLDLHRDVSDFTEFIGRVCRENIPGPEKWVEEVIEDIKPSDVSITVLTKYKYEWER